MNLRKRKWRFYSPIIGLLIFTIVAVGGFATFGLHPGLLAKYPDLASFYSISFTFFGQMHVWLAVLILAGYLVYTTGTRWLPALGVIYIVSLASELVGTTYGLPFGSYSYSELLGPKWFGRVPVVIPLSWFGMSIPAYALARYRFPEYQKSALRIGCAALLLVLWDLSLDPAMSYLTGYWAWDEAGLYYGMPLSNLAGWFLTGLVLMSMLEFLRAYRWVADLSVSWMAGYYLVTMLMPLGMVLVGGLWGAGLLTVAGLMAAMALIGSKAITRQKSTGHELQTPIPQDSLTEPVSTMNGHPRDLFKRHSRSFSFAARWFSREQRELVTCLYAFCRTTDDIVDRPSDNWEGMEARLDAWVTCAHRAYRGDSSGIPWLDRVMQVSAQKGLPFEVVQDLADGVRMDIGSVRLESSAELDLYTYRVASVVGIWLCYLFEARDKETLRRAAAMGRAMQLTNIVRDVGEDLSANRIYLPASMMARYEVTCSDLEAMADGAPISSEYEALIEELMHRADGAYRFAFRGLPALPGGFGRASAVAAEVYRGIHRAVRRNDFDNLRRRAYTRHWEKGIYAVRGLAKLWGTGRSSPQPARQREASKSSPSSWTGNVVRMPRN